MRYDANKPIDKQRAIVRLQQLINKGAIFELKEVRPLRSPNQNRYLHLILSWFALEYGETLEYVKLEIFKKLVNPELFQYEYVNRKTGEIRTEFKSTANMTTAELTTAIDRFRDYSSRIAGIYLPEPSDLVFMQEIENEVANNKHFL